MSESSTRPEPAPSAAPGVFISYAHRDVAAAHTLERLLDAWRVPYWRDRTLVGGTHWSEELRARVGSCDLFVLLASRRSLGSDHVKSETLHARTNSRKVLRIQLDDTSVPDVVSFLNDLQSIPFTTQDGRQANAQGLAQALERVGFDVPSVFISHDASQPDARILIQRVLERGCVFARWDDLGQRHSAEDQIRRSKVVVAVVAAMPPPEAIAQHAAWAREAGRPVIWVTTDPFPGEVQGGASTEIVGLFDSDGEPTDKPLAGALRRYRVPWIPKDRGWKRWRWLATAGVVALLAALVVRAGWVESRARGNLFTVEATDSGCTVCLNTEAARRKCGHAPPLGHVDARTSPNSPAVQRVEVVDGCFELLASAPIGVVAYPCGQKNEHVVACRK